MTHCPPSTILEGITLCGVAVYQVTAQAIDDVSWQRLTGSHGTLFVLAIGIIVLWNASRIREKKEDARRKEEDAARERRHAELVSTNKENAEGLKALTVDSIKANIRAIVAVESMDKNIQNLTIGIKEMGIEQRDLTHVIKTSPCLATKEFREPMPLVKS